MKALKYRMSILTLLVLGLCFFSCADEFDRREEGIGDGKTLYLSIYVPDNEVVTPMTKSDKELAEKIHNLTILIYQDGVLNTTASKYIDDATTLDKLKMDGENTLSLTFSLEEGATGKVYAIANAGNALAVYPNEDDLLNASFNLNGVNPQFVFFADGQTFDVKTNPQVEASLVRIYSKITVVVKTDGLNKEEGKKVTVTPKLVKLYNIPMAGTLKSPNLITKSDASKRDGEMLVTKEYALQNGGTAPYWNYKSEESADGNSSSVLYMYENMQPNGYCNKQTGSTTDWDQTTKTPAEFKSVVTSRDMVMTTYRASFIEVEADYAGPNAVDGTYGGTIKYRFFLGKDNHTNFEVSRNTHYKITLNLHGNGGVDEATWRVEIDKIPYTVSLSDIYVGYRAGSASSLIVPGDIENVGSVDVSMVSNPNSDTGGFDKNWVPAADNESGLLTVTAQSTNVHSYKQKIAKVTFTMKDGKTKYSANVYQVSRLVDPIAIYKKAENDSETEIVVREYNPNKKQYETLESKGPWSATIDKSSSGDWFSIYLKDQNTGQFKAVKVGETIEGEGEVIFKYKPNSPNTNTGTENVDRHGRILVKYHNNWCQHEIYVRQGFRPVVMSDTEGSAWSSFNCLGEGNKDGVAASSPTQTGWLFNGGVNKAMHPFIPGYRETVSTIKYSDGKYYPFNSFKTNVTEWEVNNGSGTVSASSIGKQGPCPDGYIVPNAWSYREMTNETEVTTGYVYDDDYRGTKYTNPNGSVTYGWKWGTNGDAEVDDDIYSNPAKGSLFVNKRDGCTNLFFGYGKGVLTKIGQLDDNLVAEIGVGHRDLGLLSYADPAETTKDKNHSYGGFYWNATSFYRYGNNSGTNHMGKVDFGYDVFRREPNLLDVPGQLAAIGGKPAIGIGGNENASFVRCVVNRSMEKWLKINAIFYRVSPDGTNRQLITDKVPTFIIGPTSVQLSITDGKVTSDFKVPINTQDGAKVTISLDGLGSVETTLGALRSLDTEVKFIDSTLPGVKMIDIKAQFVYSHKPLADWAFIEGKAQVIFTIGNTETIIEMIKGAGSYSVANGMLQVPSTVLGTQVVNMSFRNSWGNYILREATIDALMNSATVIDFTP